VSSRLESSRLDGPSDLTRRNLPLGLVLLATALLLVPLVRDFQRAPTLVEHLDRVHRLWTVRSLAVLEQFASASEPEGVAAGTLTEQLRATPLEQLQQFSPQLRRELTSLTASMERFGELAAVQDSEDIPALVQEMLLIEEHFSAAAAAVADLESQRNAAYRSLVLFAVVLAAAFVLLYLHQNTQLRSLAIERRYQQRLMDLTYRVQENERRSLARELHDGTAQELSMARMAVDRIEPGPTRDALKTTLTRAIQEIRLVCQTMHPKIVDGDHPSEMVRELALAFEDRHDLRVHLTLDEELSLAWPGDRRLHLYRILHEALVNVVRHAGARSVRVALQRSGDDVELTVADDGVGIGEAGENFGRRGMRERAEILGGAITWRANAPGGTVVSLTVPIHQR
jgi:signal transduction histidine kinase